MRITTNQYNDYTTVFRLYKYLKIETFHTSVWVFFCKFSAYFQNTVF